jgi:riboflavin kinase/FMN adenylyltransferase
LAGDHYASDHLFGPHGRLRADRHFYRKLACDAERARIFGRILGELEGLGRRFDRSIRQFDGIQSVYSPEFARFDAPRVSLVQQSQQMQVHFGVDMLHVEWPGSIACVGTFDGVHRGHQAVIGRAVEIARSRNEPCVLVTFDRHPAAVLAPDRCPKEISSLAENLARFRELGVSAAVVLPFDAALSRMPAQRFLDEVLVGAVKSNQLVVGHDFAMGHNRQGDPEWLSSRIQTTVLPPFEIGGRRVSSSAIRQAVSEGNVEAASELLGRPFSIEGIVIEGEKLGTGLGFPTANMARSFDQVTPADGVYAGWVDCRFGRYMAATNIGTRPAVRGTARTIEPYLLDYPGYGLYGDSIRLELTCYLRAELDFPSLDALKAQIAADVEEVRASLASVNDFIGLSTS